jgi:NADH dehydrogenase FAD-containing subunit
MPATASPVLGDKSFPNQDQQHFQIQYDTLIIAVGAYSQSKRKHLLFFICLISFIRLYEAFNVPGVKEHAHFLKPYNRMYELNLRRIAADYSI